MSVTIREITWDELIDRIREQSARTLETDSDELIDRIREQFRPYPGAVRAHP